MAKNTSIWTKRFGPESPSAGAFVTGCALASCLFWLVGAVILVVVLLL